MQFRKITVVGVGLLGGSIGLGIRARQLSPVVFGAVRRHESVAECLRLGVVTDASTDVAKAVIDADLVILCAPLGQLPDLFDQAAPYLARAAIVTDVGSAKGDLVQVLESKAQPRGIRFVGSHPMAGSEKAGCAASRADLFSGAICAVTPTARSDAGAVEIVADFWRALGSRVLLMAPDAHDEMVARTSHAPHVAAAGLAAMALDPAGPPEQSLLCASGFRDATRIAGGPPAMWRDIALSNRRWLSPALGALVAELESFREWLDKGDGARIEQYFAEAKRRRDAWCQLSEGSED